MPLNSTLFKFEVIVVKTILILVAGVDESLLVRLASTSSMSDDYVEMQKSLFERLCPLLIIRLLPLRVFNDINSSIMYGQLRNKVINHGTLLVFFNNYSILFMVCCMTGTCMIY